MAKGIGLIGNFRGKVGNMVGYNLKDSNNKQTQGVRVYQPVVKNPKTYGQAEQRAKLAPINATYRALKAIIDRGQEGKAYGNKSRLAWLSDAMKAFDGGWFEKGADITAPALVPLTKGSLAAPSISIQGVAVSISIVVTESEEGGTWGKISQAIINGNSAVKNGDQITILAVTSANGAMKVDVQSFVIDTTSTLVWTGGIAVGDTELVLTSIGDANNMATAFILSREGDNGAHLRSTTSLVATTNYPSTTQGDAAKEAAIKSYMAAGANTDWAEDSLQ